MYSIHYKIVTLKISWLKLNCLLMFSILQIKIILYYVRYFEATPEKDATVDKVKKLTFLINS